MRQTRHHRREFIALAASTLLAPRAFAEEAVNGDSKFTQDASLLAQRSEREDGFSGVILAARGDKVLLRQAAGFADRSSNARNSVETQFPILSISKQFTAAAIMLLVEDGKIELDDPISKFYPDAPAEWAGITIKRLLTHSSGIGDQLFSRANMDATMRYLNTQSDIVPLLISRPLLFQPGSGFQYSNTGYVLLAGVIERESGEPYEKFVAEKIFTPLGMTHTSFHTTSDLKGYLPTDLPCDVATSICRSSVTICSGVGLFFAMSKLLSKPISINSLGTKRAGQVTLKKSFEGFLNTFRSRHIWLVALFLFFFYFSPGFATPLYFVMTDHLKFSQSFIGVLTAINAAGFIAGNLFYERFFKGMTSKNALNLSILLGIIATLAYLGFASAVSAMIINFFAGFTTMIAMVASLTLAADYCPKNAEGFAYAILMSVTNLASPASDNVGSYLYEHVFSNSLTPLIVVSAAASAVAFIFVPMLKLGNKRQGDPILAVAGWGPDSEHAGPGPAKRP